MYVSCFFRHDLAKIALTSSLSVAIVFTLFTMSVCAQPSSALSAVYGRGVHAYFAGNTSQAEQLFTQVIQSGSTDPRPYYFRAMVRLGMGRQFEAENDMRVGASFEARNPGVQHSIGRSLQRVQGQGRRTLEKFRRQARVDRLQQSQQQSQLRYEQLDRRGPAVLRNPSPLPLEQPVQPPQNLSVPGAASGSGSSTGSGSSNKMGAPAPTQPLQLAPPGPVAPATAQPIPAGSATKSAEDDIFSTPAPVTPSDDVFGAEPTPAPAEAPAESDPFGELPSPAEDSATADEDPFGGEAEASESTSEDSDLFGDSGEEEEMAEEETTEVEDDPFGDSSDSAEESSADEDGPFGESSDTTEDSSADEDDPFGESSDTSEESSADEDDPFGDSADDSADSSDEDSSDTESEVDEEDPFGDFGSTSGPTGDTFAQPGATAAGSDPASQFFFSLGQWWGSRGNITMPVSQRASVASAPAVVQADFELGPTEEPPEELASAELIAEEDPFAEVGSEDRSESAEAEDDPFGDF